MNDTERARISGRQLAELGDATAALQAIVDAGLPIPSGYYLCTGKLWLPEERQERPAAFRSAGGGISTFTHAGWSQAACGTCGTVRDWLAPNSPSLHRGVILRCGQCGHYAGHDELPGRDTSPGWEKSRVLMNGTPPPVTVA